METRGYGSTYENVSIIGGVITTGDSSTASSRNSASGDAAALSRGSQNGVGERPDSGGLNSAVPSSGKLKSTVLNSASSIPAVPASAGLTSAMPNTAVPFSAMPKSSSTEGVVGLGKKPVPKPRRTSLLSSAEMTQGTPNVSVLISSSSSSSTSSTAATQTHARPAAVTAAATAEQAAAKSMILEENSESDLKLSPESAAAGT